MTTRTTRLLAWSLIAAGAALRLRQYVEGRSLWLDEASLALNVVERSYQELTHPLAYEQVAPIPFLWLCRLMTQLLGPSECALRAVPFVAGLVLPIVVWRVAIRIFGERGALVPLALSVVTTSLVYYSNEVKPYGLDALVACAFILLTLRVLESPESNTRWTWLALGGTASFLISFTAILVVPGIVAALWMRRRERPARVAACAVLWGMAFVIPYALLYATSSASEYLKTYWESAFVSPLHPAQAFAVIAGALQANIVGATEFSWPRGQEVVIAALALLGAWWMLRRNVVTFVLTTAPLVMVGMASVLHRYPIAARTTLFETPLVLLLLAGAVMLFGDWVPRRRRAAVAVGCFLVLAPGTTVAVEHAVSPKLKSDTKAVLAQLAAKRGDVPLYVDARSIRVWEFYENDWSHSDAEHVSWIRAASDLGGPAFENAASRGHPVIGEGDGLRLGKDLLGLSTGAQYRPGKPIPSIDAGWANNEARRLRSVARPDVWLLFSHTVDHSDQALRAELERRGAALVDQIEAEGAAAYEYRFGDLAVGETSTPSAPSRSGAARSALP